MYICFMPGFMFRRVSFAYSDSKCNARCILYQKHLKIICSAEGFCTKIEGLIMLIRVVLS